MPERMLEPGKTYWLDLQPNSDTADVLNEQGEVMHVAQFVDHTPEKKPAPARKAQTSKAARKGKRTG